MPLDGSLDFFANQLDSEMPGGSTGILSGWPFDVVKGRLVALYAEGR